jgi:hypothetical protein
LGAAIAKRLAEHGAKVRGLNQPFVAGLEHRTGGNC